mmetsp:Transcript_61854/g.130590  ORF Transcript_61854/g.130590 Transcript_61854/m.130590 type:complete len:299 (+) Transcript_61854:590-1486(+)
MACFTAAEPALASSIATAFSSFSLVRMAVASDIAFVRAACSSASLAMVEACSWISAFKPAMAAESSSTLAVFLFLLSLLAFNCSSHQALWSASAAASSFNFSRRPSIMPITLAKGPPAARDLARDARVSDCSAAPRERRRAAAESSAAFLAEVLRESCKKLTCWEYLAETSGEAMMSMALAIASISAARTFWFSSKVTFLAAKVVSISVFSASSSAFAALVSVNSPWAFADAAFLEARSCAFSSRSELSLAMVLLRCNSTKLNSWASFTSAFSTSESSPENFSKRLFRSSKMPPDWNL